MSAKKHSKPVSRSSRRAFIGTAASVLTAATVAKSFESESYAAPQISSFANDTSSGRQRQIDAMQVRMDAAKKEHSRPLADHLSNGDEERYDNRNHFANYSKGLPHDDLGEVDGNAWNSFVNALNSGKPADFEDILTTLGGAKLVNPQAGLAFALEGSDSHAFTQKPAPAFASAEIASEIAENYWMALTRDISYSDYTSNPLAQKAATDLTGFSDFRGPKSGGKVTPGTLFRGVTAGDVSGPYISQFLWQDTPYGAETVDRRMRTPIAGLDYLTSYSDWLSTQKGILSGAAVFDPVPRYIRNGRDLGEWVHIDVLFQAYFNALLILFRWHAPFDKGNPYTTSRTQIGFGTLGDPYIASLLCGVARDALKAVWFQKWFVHRRLRPEVFAGRVHNHKTGKKEYPVHSDILNSSVLPELFSRKGTYLLPMAFPEGSPLHPSYGAGHATVAGACVTILKAFFDESFIVPNPVETSANGLSLLPYAGPPLTVGGELDKLASNVAFGRNTAGVHWRSDAVESLKLGEEVAIRYLADEKSCANEKFTGFSLTKFDGTTVTV